MWARRVVIMDCFAEPVSPEPQLRPLPRLLGFDLAVACRRMGVQRGQEAAGRGGYPPGRAGGCLRGGLRRPVEARQVSHTMQRGGIYFLLGPGEPENGLR